MTSRLKAAGGGSKLARPVPLGTGMKSPLGRGIARPPAEREGPPASRTGSTGGQQKRTPPQVSKY